MEEKKFEKIKEEINKIAEEAKAKIDVLVSSIKDKDKEDYDPNLNPGNLRNAIILYGSGEICNLSSPIGPEYHKRGSLASDSPEGESRLKKFDEWRMFMVEFMTAGDQAPNVPGYIVEINNSETECPILYTGMYKMFGGIGQRTFSTPDLRDAWVAKKGKDCILKMLSGGMP